MTTYFYFGDGEKVVGQWNAALAVREELRNFLTYCTRYITAYPLGSPRSGGADDLWLNIETLAMRLPKGEINKLGDQHINMFIDFLLDVAKAYHKKLEWLYRPTIMAENPQYYGMNKEYIKTEDEAHNITDLLAKYLSEVDEFIEVVPNETV